MQELPIVVYFDCEAVNRKVSEKIIELDIMSIGVYCHVAEYYKPYFPDYVEKYKKFVGTAASQDFIKELKTDVENINQIIKSYNEPMEEVESVVYKEGMKCHICKLIIHC